METKKQVNEIEKINEAIKLIEYQLYTSKDNISPSTLLEKKDALKSFAKRIKDKICFLLKNEDKENKIKESLINDLLILCESIEQLKTKKNHGNE